MKSWSKSTYQELTCWSTASLPMPEMMPCRLLAPEVKQFSGKLCYPLGSAGDSSPRLSSPPSNASSHVFTSFPVSVQAASSCNRDDQVLPVNSTQSEFWFPVHRSATVPVHSFYPSILFQGTPDSQYLLHVKSNSDSSSTLPLFSRQREWNSKKRTESCKTSIPKNISDSNQIRIAVRERSIQLCIREHSLYAELKEKRGKKSIYPLLPTLTWDYLNNHFSEVDKSTKEEWVFTVKDTLKK